MVDVACRSGAPCPFGGPPKAVRAFVFLSFPLLSGVFGAKIGAEFRTYLLPEAQLEGKKVGKLELKSLQKY